MALSVDLLPASFSFDSDVYASTFYNVAPSRDREMLSSDFLRLAAPLMPTACSPDYQRFVKWQHFLASRS